MWSFDYVVCYTYHIHIIYIYIFFFCGHMSIVQGTAQNEALSTDSWPCNQFVWKGTQVIGVLLSLVFISPGKDSGIHV